MVIKSVPMDYMNTIVFAVRGTASFMDWAVNLNMEPTSPKGFLVSPRSPVHRPQHTVRLTPTAGRPQQPLPRGLPLRRAQNDRPCRSPPAPAP